MLTSSRLLAYLFRWGSARDFPGAPFAVGLGASLAALTFASLSARAARTEKVASKVA